MLLKLEFFEQQEFWLYDDEVDEVLDFEVLDEVEPDD